MRHVLSDLAVLELAQGFVGGACGKLFADLGADVLKVEPPGGDPLRHEPTGPTAPDGTRRSGALLHLLTNRRGIVLDPDDPAHTARLWRLLERADLVIESPGAGGLADHGISWDELHERLPGTSVVSVSGFGTTGPYAGFRSSDLVAQAVSGAMLLQHDAEQDPLKLPARLGSAMLANLAALGGLGAVLAARAGGSGTFVDCAAIEALATQPMKVTYLLALQYRNGVPVEAPASTLTLIPTGVFPCGDGHVAMMSTPQQLQEMLDVLDDDDLRAAFARPDAFERPETKEILDAALYPWLLSRTRAEITAAAQERGWPLAGVNHPAEVLEADHLHQRGYWVHVDDPIAGALDLPGPPARFAEGGFALRRLAPGLGQHDAEIGDGDGWRPPAAAAASSGAPARPPLEGVRVVDLTAVWSGPYATMLLADLGAEVIRVENPFVLPPTTKGYTPRPMLSNPGALGSLYGPPVPDRPDRPWNRHAMNNSLARNKYSVTIDTRRAEGRELLMRLVEQADVFIDNFKANGLARIGIQLSELQARNPRLVIVRLPPAGTTGDWAHYTGFGAQFDGLSGLAWLCGHRGSDPVTTPATTYMDASSGPAAAFATIAALHYRDVTGRGQVVEMVQSENVIQQLGDVMVDCQLGEEPARLGNRDRFLAPQGLYPCRGEHQWLALTITDDAQWPALAKVIGRPDLADDDQLRDAPGRQRHHDELDCAITAWTRQQDRDEAFLTLQAEGVPAGPLLDPVDVVRDPHLQDRGWMRPLTSLDVGTHLHPGWAFRGLPEVWRHGSPVLGEHNDHVYREILGVSEEEMARYRAEKMLADDYLDPEGQPY